MTEQQRCATGAAGQDAARNNAEPFKREDRYIVIKRKDLAHVPLAAVYSLFDHLRDIGKHLPQREYVVIESDWPEYETVWAILAARVEGRPTPHQVLEQQIAALRQHKAEYMEAAEETRRALEAEAQALRDEVAALRLELGGMQMEMAEVAYRLSPALLAELKRLVAFAYDQGIEGAEEAGRQLEGLMGQEALRARVVVVPDSILPHRERSSVDPGFNEALRQVARLNGKVVSEGLLRVLVGHATGEIKHLNNGMCPDDLEGHDTRDPDCAVCRALLGDGKEDGHA